MSLGGQLFVKTKVATLVSVATELFTLFFQGGEVVGNYLEPARRGPEEVSRGKVETCLPMIAPCSVEFRKCMPP